MKPIQLFQLVESDCPLCKGSGEVDRISMSDSSKTLKASCNHCKSTGIISDYVPVPVSGVPSEDQIEKSKPVHGRHDPPLWDFWWISGAKWMRNKALPSLAALTAELEAEKARRKEADKAVYETMQENKALSEERDRMKEERDNALKTLKAISK